MKARVEKYLGSTNRSVCKNRKRTILLSVSSFFLLLAVGTMGVYFWIMPGLPDPETIDERLNPPSIRITDRQNRLLYEMFPESGGRHTDIPLENIPVALRQATIATEDQNFYANIGIDAPGILRSLWINLRGGQTLAGGSTITQQVARTLLLEPEERSRRTLHRKLREMVLAWQITRQYDKDEILELYLNQTYYGQLSYGVEAAAQTYFGKSVSGLDLAECALLAGLPQAPAAYDPFESMPSAKERQAVVLSLMKKQGMITSEEVERASREQLQLATSPFPMEAPHFVMLVRSQLDRLFTPAELRSGSGWTVKTTLNLDWQNLAEQSVTGQLEKLQTLAADPFGHNVNSAALVAVDPHSGEILAMVGSPDYFDAAQAGAINMTLSPRQPGSALKPLIYAAAFDPTGSDSWTAGTMILDVTTHFNTHEGKTYTPVNYDGLEHGPVLVREALASSLNIPAVITLAHIGLPEFYTFAGRLGITTLGDPNRADLSVALGGGEVRLLELTAAYGVFASGGNRVIPYSIEAITDSRGTAIYRHTPAPTERVLDERVAWLISNILSDDSARFIGFGRDSVLRLDRPAAVKTGTTTNFHDNWTVGYTPSLVVGVWVGNTSHEAMHNITGLTGAAPIWAQMMRSILAGKPEEAFVQPEGLIQIEICSLSGNLPTPDCPNRKLEWFIEGTQPKNKDALYHRIEINAATGQPADPATPAELRTIITAVDLPPAAESWARSHGMMLWNEIANKIYAQTAGDPATARLQIISPAPKSIFFISGKIPPDVQKVKLEAVGTAGLTAVTFWVDGNPAEVVHTAPYETWWQLLPGKHTIRASGADINGTLIQSEPVSIEVR